MKPQAEAKRMAKVEKFCQLIIERKTQSDAYRACFNTKRWKKETIHSRASEYAASSKVVGRLKELSESVKAFTKWSLEDRMKELSYAGQLDPIHLYDENGQPRKIADMPEEARRAIAGFEVDAEKFTTKIKLIDKRGAIMDYTRLAGDMPVEITKVQVGITVEHLVGLIKRKEPKIING